MVSATSEPAINPIHQLAAHSGAATASREVHIDKVEREQIVLHTGPAPESYPTRRDVKSSIPLMRSRLLCSPVAEHRMRPGMARRLLAPDTLLCIRNSAPRTRFALTPTRGLDFDAGLD
ncbi:hypothetical protein FRC12_007940 [Ceratobasidium sp. 428]|nr:hypothetical protein FRC12_007940 [Ceratobasidium sp. 428]